MPFYIEHDVMFVFITLVLGGTLFISAVIEFIISWLRRDAQGAKLTYRKQQGVSIDESRS